MRKLKKTLLSLFIIILVIGVLSGCGKQAEKIEAEFAELISAEEKVSPESMTAAAEYMKKYLKKLPEYRAGSMLSTYEAFAAQYINTDADAAQVQSLLPFFDSQTGEVDSAKLKKDKNASAYCELLKKSYIRPVAAGDKIVLQLDYNAICKEFGKQIPETLADLYDLKDLIERKPATENATLNVSYNELLRRAYKVERLIRENKDEEVYDLIMEDTDWLYSSYLNIIFMGTTNSPVFDYETGAFSQEAETAYLKFYRENPDSVLAGAIHDYFRYLASIEYTMDYKDSDMSKAFFDNCSRIVSETGKRVKE